MPLNYDKWNALELSDDSDIEGHPNVDHASLVRMKQRQIHEKRAEQKQTMMAMEQEHVNNRVLYPKIIDFTNQVEQGGSDAFSSIVERLRTQPSPDAPAPGAPMRYDDMLLDLMNSISQDCKKEEVDMNDKTKLGEILVRKLKGHQLQIQARQKVLESELEKQKAERGKLITSEDIHEGFSSSYMKGPDEPKPIESSLSKSKHKGKKKMAATTIETLNAPAPAQGPDPSLEEEPDDEESDSEEEGVGGLPGLTPELLGFSKIKIGNYEESYQYIQEHRSVYVSGADDALLVAAYDAESKGQNKYAKQCVNQALLLQYCEKLGKDGPALFFRRAIAGHVTALTVFTKDVEDTYNLLRKRVKASKEDMNTERETIQLVPAEEGQTITFDVPDGPPPAELQLSDDLKEYSVEQVREALQGRWDMFMSFKPKLRKALKNGSLDEVNKVLGAMDVSEAETVVTLLHQTGILNFADNGQVRDMTGRVADTGA